MHYRRMVHGAFSLLQGDKAGVEERETKYQTLVNAYYELATLFYEWGWGQCFHFATLGSRERFIESIRRHEYYLAGKLGVTRGQKVRALAALFMLFPRDPRSTETSDLGMWFGSGCAGCGLNKNAKELWLLSLWTF